ncbi:DUF2608 domain-containing protein [Leclercia sp. LTM14]|uniref:DUF2608 domain-containing protein n=2 Tax=Enterobacteriaceae TaxID=543 RepID=A0ABS7RXE1_9ENTR|nr:DUF2608 domain-containing protein [Leclercia sp. EMC7]MCM5701156.1 DUF2608 domain-containing protein [Leclercia sp. LTM14]
MYGYIAALSLLNYIPLSIAAVTTIESDSYDIVASIIKDKDTRYQPENVLLVFDIDNTVLTSQLEVGGDIWYQWQAGKLPLKPGPEEKVPCLYENAIALLYSVGSMTLTEPHLNDYMSKWQEKHSVVALTSRAPDTRNATERELRKNGVNFSASPLAALNESSMPVYQGRLKRSYNYNNGIMFSSGMDKGVMLDFMLDKTKRKFDSIVFVDDGIANIQAMKTMLESEKYRNVDTVLVHYTKVESDLIKQQGQVLTPGEAKRMTQNWKKLLKTLDEIFPNRVISCDVEKSKA